MSDYGFTHNDTVFTPNATSVTLTENEARNKAIEAQELVEWSKQPDRFLAYVTDKDLTTWLGTHLGRVIRRATYRNNLGAKIESVTVQSTNGAVYHGRYGCEWGQAVRLRRGKYL